MSDVAFDPKDIRYIKLGSGGAWERTSLEGGTLEWGNDDDPHEMAAGGAWDAMHGYYRDTGRPRATATSYVREARDFYSGDRNTLWITFSGGYLWWAFANPEVFDRGASREPGQAARYRKITGGWRNTDLRGRELRMADLSTSLTQLSAYRQTICSVSASDYLLRRIRCEEGADALTARYAREALSHALLPIIQMLHQNDFELFVDLLFSAMGWRRVSILGGTMKDIDLLLELPATRERAVVQVKSKADQPLADRCIGAMATGWPDARAYFVCHTAPASLSPPAGNDRAEVLTGHQLAGAAIDHGLTPWLMTKAA